MYSIKRMANDTELVADFLGAMLIVLVFLAVVECRDNNPNLSHVLPQNSREFLGAEYDSIARAIRQGRGFSDPFKVESGPSAWMPPVLPYLLAGLYWLCNDDRNQVVNAILLLQLLSNAATGFLVLRAARSVNALFAAYCSIIVVFLVNLYWLFQRTHDVWLLLIIYDVIWLGAMKRWSKPQSLAGAITWGAAGGLIALCSPIAGFTWAVVTCATGLQLSVNRKQRSYLAVVVATSMVVVIPWTVRNRVVLERWVPIKSNFAYEVWQAQCVDEDGVLDSSVFRKHPWPSDGPERQRYIEVGEMEFVSSRWPLIRSSVVRSPGGYIERTLNRAKAALWYHTSISRAQENLWITHLQRAVFWLPFAGLLLTVAIRSHSPIALKEGGEWAVMIYVCGLVVYVLFSFYQRYSAPLSGIQMLLMVYGFAKIKGLLQSSVENSSSMTIHEM